MDDPAKFERYQAEALVHQYCPIEALLGMICYNEKIKSLLEQQLATQFRKSINGLRLILSCTLQEYEGLSSIIFSNLWLYLGLL